MGGFLSFYFVLKLVDKFGDGEKLKSERDKEV